MVKIKFPIKYILQTIGSRCSHDKCNNMYNYIVLYNSEVSSILFHTVYILVSVRRITTRVRLVVQLIFRLASSKEALLLIRPDLQSSRATRKQIQIAILSKKRRNCIGPVPNTDANSQTGQSIYRHTSTPPDIRTILTVLGAPRQSSALPPHTHTRGP